MNYRIPKYLRKELSKKERKHKIIQEQFKYYRINKKFTSIRKLKLAKIFVKNEEIQTCSRITISKNN